MNYWPTFFAVVVIMGVTLVAISAILHPQESPWRPVESMETDPRVELCRKMGLEPVIEFWRDEAKVSGCAPKAIQIR